MLKWLEQYFTFTKGERNAIIALVMLSLLVLIAPRVYLYFKPVKHETYGGYLKQAEGFSNQYKNGAPAAKNPETADSVFRPAGESESPGQYFNFDPNKIGVAEWVQLGFTEKQATTIEHYKAAGARFYTPQDLKKLFVMTPEHYQALLPFVKIDNNALPPKNYRHND